MNAEQLEADAMEARRRADIAKHVPLAVDDLENLVDEALRRATSAQCPLIEKSLNLSNDYAEELRRLRVVIKKLRADALYWRQKAKEATT